MAEKGENGGQVAEKIEMAGVQFRWE